MSPYHLEHPRYPRLYRFEVAGGYVVVERWDGGNRSWVKNLTPDQARRLYKFLRDKVGYRTFGFSARREVMA